MWKHLYMHCFYGKHSKIGGKYLGWPIILVFLGLSRFLAHGTCHEKVPANKGQIGHPMDVIFPTDSWGNWSREKQSALPGWSSKLEADIAFSLLYSNKSIFATKQIPAMSSPLLSPGTVRKPMLSLPFFVCNIPKVLGWNTMDTREWGPLLISHIIQKEQHCHFVF